MKKYDFIIIGSGFGGSVSAMRLAQKGYSVLVLEEGLRWRDSEFPKTNWNLRKYLWAPLVGCFGIQAITLLRGVMVLHGKGVGGGSLVYANTLMRPSPEVFSKPGWGTALDWHAELSLHFERAQKMLGVTTNKYLFSAEQALLEVGKRMKIAETYHATEVGVYFGENSQPPGTEAADPYFAGQGPGRASCTACGGCMVGCRYNAKNTLEKNYLFFAEKWGTKILAGQAVKKIESRSEGYVVHTQKAQFLSERVIVAAGVLGTLKLLLRCRDEHGTLPKLSARLGERVRTNGESLLGATTFDKAKNFSEGIAIGAAIHPDEQTKIEAVKYSQGSDLLRYIAVPLTGPGNRFVRPLKLLMSILRRLPRFIRLNLVRDWARSSIILLVMQSIETNIDIRWRRGFFGWKLAGDSKGATVPSYIPVAQTAAQHLASVIQGEPQNVAVEVLAATPTTAHILGGAAMGTSAENSVINTHHEVHGYPGLYICDGSVISSNLGVNPSLTISAMAERFSSLFPEKELGILESREIQFSADAK